VFRSIVVGLSGAAVAGLAIAQEAARDVGDPSITKKPALDFQNATPPEYPRVALRNGLHGNVKISTCVDEAGKPHSVSVSESSGHDVLDEASRKWIAEDARFKPAEAGGTPVAVCNYTFTYECRLPEGAGPVASETVDYEEASAMRPEDLPVALRRPSPPPYPPGALARQSAGTIRYSICIGPDGLMKEVHILDPSVDMELAVAGFYWFGSTTYRPGQKDGKPVGVCGIEVEYTWRLPTPPATQL
jgi:TonB family protein